MHKPHDTPGATLAGELPVLIGKLKRRLREASQLGDFTLSETSVLGRLRRDGPATVTALARADGMRPQSMGATVAALEAAGMVGGTPDPADRRQTIWTLTPVGRERIDVSRGAREHWLTRVIDARLTPQEQAQLAAALPLLQRLANA